MNIFKNSQFLKLWFNQILLQTAFNMANFTALLLIDQITSSRFALAQFYAAVTIPAFLFGLFAGSIVDVTNKKSLLVATNLFLAVFFSLYTITTNHFGGLLILAFATSTIIQFFAPAEQSVIPLIVNKKHLDNANAIFLFTSLGTVLSGYALAGPVIQTFGGLHDLGTRVSFLAAGILSLIGFLLQITLNPIETAKLHIFSRNLFGQALALTYEGFIQTKNNRKILIPILLLTLIEFNLGFLAILFLDYVKEYLKLQTTTTSYLLIVPLVAGLGIGVLLFTKIGKRINKANAVMFASIIIGISILATGFDALLFVNHYLSLFTLRFLAVASAVLMGICAVFISVPARTVLQENTPKQMLGRIFSLVTIAASSVTPLAVLLIAFITEKVHVSTVFMYLGVGLLFVITLLRPSITEALE